LSSRGQSKWPIKLVIMTNLDFQCIVWWMPMHYILYVILYSNPCVTFLPKWCIVCKTVVMITADILFIWCYTTINYIPGIPSSIKPRGIYTWTSLLDKTPGNIYLDFPTWWSPGVYLPGLPSLMKPRGIYIWTSFLDWTPGYIYMDPSSMKPRA